MTAKISHPLTLSNARIAHARMFTFAASRYHASRCMYRDVIVYGCGVAQPSFYGNMAGSAEYGALIQHTGDLKLAVRANLTSLGAQLLSAKVITTDQYDEIRIAQRSSNDRAADLVRYVQDKVRQNCQHYYAFIGALKEDESEYRDILAKLEESLKRGAQPREGGDRQPIPTVPTRGTLYLATCINFVFILALDVGGGHYDIISIKP